MPSDWKAERMRTRGRQAFEGLAIVAAAAGIDQFVRYLVENGMEYHEKIDIFPFFALFRTNNTGIAFSMFGDLGAVPLSVLTIAVSAFVVFLWHKTPQSDRIARFGFALIVGGALGNLVDRVMLGHVVDYFLFHTPVWSFAVFNLADSFITVGAALVVLQELLRWFRHDVESEDGEKSPRDD
jgi:signal peptidase II